MGRRSALPLPVEILCETERAVSPSTPTLALPFDGEGKIAR